MSPLAGGTLHEPLPHRKVVLPAVPVAFIFSIVTLTLLFNVPAPILPAVTTGALHVPSPRQKVVEFALVPEFMLPMLMLSTYILLKAYGLAVSNCRGDN
jgi:hypothetical protein